jgi:hypothetical protein
MTLAWTSGRRSPSIGYIPYNPGDVTDSWGWVPPGTSACPAHRLTHVV